MNLERIKTLQTNASSKVVLLVMDGLGGLPGPDGATELEAADTKNLDKLAAQSLCGLHEPVGGGITPGSGPAHLALFGYDPLQYQVGRGVLSAAGIDFDLQATDVACRGNFCTVDTDGRVTDRRAGRIATEKNLELVEKLRGITLSTGEVFVETIKEHRFLVVFRAEGLGEQVNDTDPKVVGRAPHKANGGDDASQATAALANEFVEKAREILASEEQANMTLLRGFAKTPAWPTFEEVYGTKAASIAAYPMYRGLAKLLGMTALDAGEDPTEKFETLMAHRDEYDFFFIHVKKPDKAGEDGDFDAKVESIEKVDAALPALLAAKPDVLIITGDHSTPWALKNHSWHPVPTIIHSAYCRPDGVSSFGERACIAGGLGPRFPATHLMPLAMANALRMEKFGA
ncbi:MAG: 2,3-bisphosphoglycerate-independent phosphoglycerate mutase [Alkalispirochaeta sp.]